MKKQIGCGFHVGRPKNIGPLIVKKTTKPLSYSEAHQLKRDMKRYWWLLKNKGVPVPRFFFPFCVYQRGWRVVEVSSYCGNSLGLYLKNVSDEEYLIIISRLIAIFNKVLPRPDSETFEVKVAIDPVLNNFTLIPGGEISYVDFIPPRFVEDGRTLLTFPSSTSSEKDLDLRFLKSRYLDARGLSLIFLVQSSRVRPRLRSHILDLMLKNLPPRLSEFLLSLPTQELLKSRKKEIIEKLKPEDADLARDMACILIPEGGPIEEVYRLSHVECAPPPQSKIEKIKEILLTFT